MGIVITDSDNVPISIHEMDGLAGSRLAKHKLLMGLTSGQCSS